MKLQKIKQSTVALMAVIVIAKLVGMARDVVLANYFGTGNVSDAYLIAVSVPTLLFYFIGHALSTAFLPMYHKVQHERGEADANRYTNNLLCTSLVVSTVIVAILLAVPQLVIKLFAAGFDAETAALTAQFVRLSAPSLYLMAIVNIWSGYLHAKNNFLVPAAISFPRNGVMILSIILAATVSQTVLLGWGLLFAYVAEMLLLLPFVLRAGFRPKPTLRWRDPEIKETLFLVLPVILSVGVGQINKIVDRSIASTIVSGGISALNYASVINNAVQEVLVTGIVTILFAKCAAWVSEGKHELVKQKLRTTMEMMGFLLIPASLGIIALAEPIVRCLLGRGRFDAASVAMTSEALQCYTVGLLFLALRDTMVKVLFAYKKTGVATATSVAAIAVNIVLNLILSRFWGINGLAIATSISAIFQCVILYVLLWRQIGDFGTRRILLGLLQSGAAGMAMFFAVRYLMRYLMTFSLGETTCLFLAVTVGAAVYAALSLALCHRTALGFARRIFRRKPKENE